MIPSINHHQSPHSLLDFPFDWLPNSGLGVGDDVGIVGLGVGTPIASPQ